MSEIHPSLLPNGLKDLLSPKADQEANIINQCMQVFSSFSYQRVKPPLVEFEECLLAPGPGQALSKQTFRLMDPVSGRMMGVRADTTAQIARIAGSRLGDEARPLRLSYAADILRVNATQLRPDRQFCQVGCELIGTDSVGDDVEIMLIALKALKECGIGGISIDLTLPSVVDAILEQGKLSESDKADLQNLLQKRDRDGLVESKHKKVTAPLVELLDASGVAKDAAAALKKLKLPRAVSENIDLLLEVYNELIEALEAYDMADVAITIDLIEHRGFDYQKGVSFTLFSKNIRGELGSGGRYDIQYDGGATHESATGFTLYMDSIMRADVEGDITEYQCVENDEKWTTIKSMQDKGAKVMRCKN